MKRGNETEPIIEKYKDLHEACLKYPKIILGNKPKKYKSPQGYAKDGFVERFCK